MRKEQPRTKIALKVKKRRKTERIKRKREREGHGHSTKLIGRRTSKKIANFSHRFSKILMTLSMNGKRRNKQLRKRRMGRGQQKQRGKINRLLDSPLGSQRSKSDHMIDKGPYQIFL
jgi:hypothetical protein